MLLISLHSVLFLWTFFTVHFICLSTKPALYSFMFDVIKLFVEECMGREHTFWPIDQVFNNSHFIPLRTFGFIIKVAGWD